jgi:hypothetical protein
MYHHSARHFFPAARPPVPEVVRALPLALLMSATIWALVLTLLALGLYYG